MRRLHPVRLLLPAVLTAGMLSACAGGDVVGSLADGVTNASTGPEPSAEPSTVPSAVPTAVRPRRTSSPSMTAPKVARIGVLAPLTGNRSAAGLGIRNAVDLAVTQANMGNRVPGWRFEVVVKDDASVPATGAQAAAALAADNLVVGVIGSVGSDVAELAAPALAAGDIVMVSPADTTPSLTGKDQRPAQQRVHPNFFRVCTSDDHNGAFAAQQLLGMSLRKVAIVHDKRTYGQALQQAFATAFKTAGGSVTITETVNADDNDFSAVVNKVLATSPDAVFYGGQYLAASILSKQLHDKGFTGPLVGGDEIFSPDYITRGGEPGDLASTVSVPGGSLRTGSTFMSDYQARGYTEPYGPYGPLAYDAATALITALAGVLPDEDDVDAAVRRDVIAAVQAVSVPGVTGNIGFDAFGDATTRTLSSHVVQGGAWIVRTTQTV